MRLGFMVEEVWGSGWGGREGVDSTYWGAEDSLMRMFSSVTPGPHIAILVMLWRLTYAHKGERFMQQSECAIDGTIEPRVVSARSKGDQVLLVLDVLLFGVMQRVVGLDVVPHAAVFGLRRPTRRKQLLRRVQKRSYQQRSATERH